MFTEPRRGAKKAMAPSPARISTNAGDILPILEKAGWNFHSQRGNKAYFTRPGKTSGISASLVEGKVFYWLLKQRRAIRR